MAVNEPNRHLPSEQRYGQNAICETLCESKLLLSEASSVLRVAEGLEPWPDFDSSDFIPNRSLDFGEISRLCPQPASRATLRRSGKQAADRNGQDARKLHFPNRKQARRI